MYNEVNLKPTESKITTQRKMTVIFKIKLKLMYFYIFTLDNHQLTLSIYTGIETIDIKWKMLLLHIMSYTYIQLHHVYQSYTYTNRYKTASS